LNGNFFKHHKLKRDTINAERAHTDSFSLMLN